ncbi:hypothetical protein D8674_029086 [Pyrus ussuriensis x Pyrus communis]|uniref:CCHC-type domain-containing protein n=1 Tax=Pyrus ussuriensis x Pyrus communis TaxID=2448454 RepID=A0A5N5HYZ2_9ROSA|nr:hypothetical protein D8674_029086 [Pyrus ussuriensis x Pyrus communis]
MNLGLLEFAIAFKQPKPHALTTESTKEQKDAFEKWERANEMSLLIMQSAMEEHIRGGIPSCDLAKDYLTAIGEKYKRSDKVEAGSYLSSLTSAKFDGIGSIREHLLKLVNIANKLNNLDVPISEQFLVHMALGSLSAEYEQVKINYNTQKESWSVNEMIAICCQEERLKKGKEEAVNLVNMGKGKKAAAFNKFGNAGNFPIKSVKFKAGSSSGTKKGAQNFGVFAKNVHSSNLKVSKDCVKKCHFCQSTEHLRRDCAGFKAWLIKKGIQKPEGTK